MSKMKKFADIVQEFNKSNDFTRKLKEVSALRAWERAISSEIARNTSPKCVRNGTLYVRAKSPTWAQELSALVPKLREQVNEFAGEYKVRDIKFLYESFMKEEDQTDPAIKPELGSVKVDAAARRRAEQTTRPVHDDALREKLFSLMIRNKQLDQWRREKGWSPCPTCGSLVSTEERGCRFCSTK